MIRRFVNVVAQNYESSMYSLHRLDVAKHLFYPSTADAEAAAAAANASENGNDGRVGGRKPKPRMFDRLRRLPAPIMRFQPPPTADSSCWSPPAGTFVLLSPRSSEGRILHIGADGHALLYDADSCSTCTMPGFDEPERPIAIAVAGNEESEGLYMITDHQNYQYGFKVLDLRQHPRRWQPLPLPPFAAKYSSHIKSFTVVDGGRTICVSCNEPAVDELELFRVAWPVDLADRTYCFDTASREWRRAGEWALPFDGRAEYVPELNTWVGFLPYFAEHPHHLCSSDLSAIDAMGAPREAPTLEHVWEDLSLPPDEKVSIVLNRRFPNIIRTTTKKWCVGNPSLVNLGSGKFCIAKVVLATETVSLSYSYTPDDEPLGEFAVLTGVEVVPDGEGGLRMVKHKSKRYVFTSDEIKWVF